MENSIITDTSNNNKNSEQIFQNRNFYEPKENNSKKKLIDSIYLKSKEKFSSYLKLHKKSIKLFVNQNTNKKISAKEFLQNNFQFDLTPIPYKSNRKIKNEIDKKNFNKFKRNAIFLRRIEYTKNLNEFFSLKKYEKFSNKIILIQKFIRKFLVKNVVNEIIYLKHTIENFISKIKNFCFIKCFCENFENKIDQTEIFSENNFSKICKNENNNNFIENAILDNFKNEQFDDNKNNSFNSSKTLPIKEVDFNKSENYNLFFNHISKKNFLQENLESKIEEEKINEENNLEESKTNEIFEKFKSENEQNKEEENKETGENYNE